MSIYEGSNQYSTSAEMNVDSVLELDDHYRRVVIPTVSIVAAILISFTGENEDVIKRAERWAEKQQGALANILRHDERYHEQLLLKKN